MDYINILLPGAVAVIAVLLVSGFKRITLPFGKGNIVVDRTTAYEKSKIIDYVKETCSIEMYRRPTEQKMYMNDKVNQMIRIILFNHVKLLEKKGIVENYFSHPQYIVFSHIVEIALRQMKDNSEIRFNYMNEHFNKTQQSEFNKFASDTAAEFIGQVSTIISDEWIDLGISKEENFEWTRQLIPEISKMIIDIYENAFNIQIKYSQLICELKEKIYNC